MLILAALAHADAPLPPIDPSGFERGFLDGVPSGTEDARVDLPTEDIVRGRRYTHAYDGLAWRGNGIALPDGVTVTVPLHQVPLGPAPTRDLATLVGLVPGMLPARGGTLSAEGLAPVVYLDGVRTMDGLPPGRW